MMRKRNSFKDIVRCTRSYKYTKEELEQLKRGLENNDYVQDRKKCVEYLNQLINATT